MGRPKKNKDGELIDTVTGDEKLGPDLIAELAEKEWATAPLPSEDELKKEKKKSPMTRDNINSRKNLIQYQKNKPKAVKEKILEGLPIKEKREKINPFDYIKLPADMDESIFRAFLPSRQVFFEEHEEIDFYKILSAFLHDFDITDLTASDIEDVVSLSTNRILESRLLNVASEDSNILLDISATIEKFRKHSEKVKMSLASRRSDRIDVKNKQSFSIVDLVSAYDEKKKTEFDDRIIRMEEEEKAFLIEKGKKGL